MWATCPADGTAPLKPTEGLNGPPARAGRLTIARQPGEHILRPKLSAVQHTQNTHDVASDGIGGNVGCAPNNQLPRSFDAAGATALREAHQALNLLSDAIIHIDGCLWAVRFKVVKDRIAIGLRESRPLELHRLSHLALRGGSPFGKVGFDLLVRDAGTGIVQRLLHFRAEPGIMGGGVIG
jgi:hypothetical protein